jgi:hypothetical protein
MNLIKKFEDYFKEINEAFNTDVDITWIETNDNMLGTFKVDENIFKIECYRQIGNNWSYSFCIYKNNIWSYDIADLGKNGFSVLSAVIKGLNYLYNKQYPNSIMFSAIDDSNTRKRLYEKFCNDFCKKHDYKLSNRGNDSKVFFILFKDGISENEKEEIFNSVKKVIENGK